MIYSALYFPGSLDDPQSLVRDNRWYPGKCAEGSMVWWQYLRRHYPDEHVVLFVDESSPVPVSPFLDALQEPYQLIGRPVSDGYTLMSDIDMEVRVHVKVLDQFAGQYFRPMQRNLVEAICMAYERNENLIWLDSDCFLATDIRPLIAGAEVVSSSIEHHQLTMGSFCWYVSAARLHDLDRLTGGPGTLPRYLRAMVNEGPTETRMHSLQEGGLYKLFCYGKALDMGDSIDMSHLSCYPHFMSFLRANPLDTPEYRALVARLEAFDFTQLPGVQLAFHDAYHTDKRKHS